MPVLRRAKKGVSDVRISQAQALSGAGVCYLSVFSRAFSAITNVSIYNTVRLPKYLAVGAYQRVIIFAIPHTSTSDRYHISASLVPSYAASRASFAPLLLCSTALQLRHAPQHTLSLSTTRRAAARAPTTPEPRNATSDACTTSSVREVSRTAAALVERHVAAGLSSISHISLYARGR